MRHMRWPDEFCVRLCNHRSAGSVCLPWLPHVREHSVHGVQSESMQLMGQSTTQLSDSVHVLTRPSCRKTSSLVRTGCRLAWLKQLSLAFQVWCEWIRSDHVVCHCKSSVKWEDIFIWGVSQETGAQYPWRLKASMWKVMYLHSLCICYLLTLPRLYNLSIAANAVEETQAETFPTHGILTQLARAPVYDTDTHTHHMTHQP